MAEAGEDEQEYIHEKYMGELVPGVFLPATRERLLSIADRMIEREQIEGLILGGTELPLLLRSELTMSGARRNPRRALERETAGD